MKSGLIATVIILYIVGIVATFLGFCNFNSTRFQGVVILGLISVTIAFITSSVFAFKDIDTKRKLLRSDVDTAEIKVLNNSIVKINFKRTQAHNEALKCLSKEITITESGGGLAVHLKELLFKVLWNMR